MHLNVLDLHAFYSSRQGQLVRRLLGREIRAHWPDLRGSRVLGLGYALPFMSALAATAERTAIIMPKSQGVVPWPGEQANLVALSTEDDLPIADRSVDRILIVHTLETTEQIGRMLREVWRVLEDRGQIIVVVPNRRGLWCLSEQTPFGQGRPFSSTQLKQLLRSHLFAPQKTGFALFAPPLRSRLLHRTAIAWERIGLRLAQRFAGVVVMVAEKQIYAAPAEIVGEARRKPAYVELPVQASIAAEREADRSAIEDGAAAQHRSG